MIRNTTAKEGSEKNEHGGILNMAGRRRNGYRTRNGGDPEHAEIKRVCDFCETRLDSLEKFSDELRLGQVERQEQIRGLRFDVEAIKKTLDDDRATYRTDKTAITLESTHLREALDSLRVDFGERTNTLRADYTLALTNLRSELTEVINKGLLGLDKKFDDNKNYFTRYFIIILVTILTGIIVGGATFILNR